MNPLYWSDYRPLYFLVAYGGALILCLMTALPSLRCQGANTFNRPSWIFLGFLGLWMVAVRWPGYFYYLPFDPDEAQIVAAAQTLATQPVLYRMADGASAGPLVIYCAGLPWLFGTVPSLFMARLMAVLLAWLGVLAIYLGLRITGFELAARLGALVAALFYGFTSFWNFVHYNSEMLPSALCAGATACLLGMFQEKHRDDKSRWRRTAYLAAFLLSMVPFAKLQLVPLALCIGLLVYGRGVWILRGQWRALVRYSVLLALSVLAFPIAFVLFIFFGGAFDYFFHTYIINNFLYAGGGDFSRHDVAIKLLKTGADMIPWAGGVLLSILAALILCLVTGGGKCSKGKAIALICIALAGVSGYCVLVPSRDYIHYLLLLPMPLSFALGAVVAWMLDAGERTSCAFTIRWCACGIFFLSLLPFCIQVVKTGEPWAGSADYWSHKPLDGIRAEIKKRANSPADGLLVWGYVPELHVTTGIHQASRLSVTAGAIQRFSLTSFYRKTLMEDLVKNHPRFIVDAVCSKGFIFTDNSLYGPQCFPEFEEFLKTQYRFVGTFSEMKLYERSQ